ncbi:MAG: hypothetical protein KAG61_03320 [Bacteriovoracaceae bacterium]|nr:hypothetical protein [Bacteriovoracaceae bacterium]
MEYTFYGDLLGFSNYYRLSPEIAYNRLNDFYRTVHKVLKEHITGTERDVEVVMMSDSVLVWGNDAHHMLGMLQQIYIELIHKGLFLRGAMVDKRLQRVPQFNLKNFDDFLPTDDTLARAVGLSETKKGARFIIGTKLAQGLLEEHPNWLTHDGYIRNPKKEIPLDSILRRICPTPDCETFEFLYFWSTDEKGVRYDQRVSELTEISNMLHDSITIQYQETIDLLRRSKRREEFTLKGRDQLEES